MIEITEVSKDMTLEPVENPDDKPYEGKGTNDTPSSPVPMPPDDRDDTDGTLTDERKATMAEKVHASLFWIGFKHFIYGFALAGAASLAAGGAPLVALGLGIAGGVGEATRKVTKEKAAANGSDWADVLDKMLQVVILLVKAWMAKKSSKKS